jgi:hypothetical protein
LALSAWFKFLLLGEFAPSRAHTKFRGKGGRLFIES